MLQKSFFIIVLVGLVGCTVVPHHTSIVTDDAAGTVRFDMKPLDANVYVDDQLVGSIRNFSGKNKRMKLSQGTHTVKIIKEGYKELSRTFYLSDTEEVFCVDLPLDENAIQKSFTIRT